MLAAFAAGYRLSSPHERTLFVAVTSFAATLTCARSVNYIRERRRPAPRLRSLVRRVRVFGDDDVPRIHHYLPGLVLALGRARRPDDRPRASSREA